jgi:hypothetical protein
MTSLFIRRNPPNDCQQLADWEVRLKEKMKHCKQRTQFNTPTTSWIVVTLPVVEVLGLSGLSTQIGRIVDNYQENQNPKRFLGYIMF